MGALIIVAIALAAIAAAQKKSTLAAAVDRDEQAKTLFNVIRNRLVYKPQLRAIIINTYFSRQLQLTDQPNLVLLVAGPGEAIGFQQSGAWFMLRALHADGFNIWVPTNAHIPVALPQPALFLPPSDPGPAEGFARLIAVTEPWPAPPATLATFVESELAQAAALAAA